MCCIALVEGSCASFFPGYRHCTGCCRSELAKNVIGDNRSILFMMWNLTVFSIPNFTRTLALMFGGLTVFKTPKMGGKAVELSRT